MIVRTLTHPELSELLKGCMDRGIQVTSPTVEELADDFAPESVLNIIRHRDLRVWLSADGTQVKYDDEIPVWIAHAIAIYQSELVGLMQEGFLGNWR